MAAQTNPTRLQPGEMVAGKYRVEHVLGSGGMGVLVAARHAQLGERVALKFLRTEIAGNPEVVARFLREARTAARIKGEHIARIVDLGTPEDGAPFIAMEFLEGCDLQDHLSKRGALPVADAVDFLVQACVAVSEAHAAGIVHRDLKPSNLFLTRRADGSALIKVLDFGISKVVAGAEAATSLTCSNAVLGSPAYMSPEQARNARSVDARADVWSLGVILHCLIAGEPPFWGESITELLSAVLSDPPKRLTQVRPDAPPELEAVILACLEKDVARRMPNVAALAAALWPWAGPSTRVLIQRIGGTLPAAARPPTAGARPAVASDAPMRTTNAWSRGLERPARTRMAVALLGVAVFAGLAAIAQSRLVHKGTTIPLASRSGEPSERAHAAASVGSSPAPAETSSPAATLSASATLLPAGLPIALPNARRPASTPRPPASAAAAQLPMTNPSAVRAPAPRSSSPPPNLRELFNDRQ
jgi:serine/threonine-protein kinase